MKCRKCNEEVTGRNLHCHHIFPISLGGSWDGKTIFLCANCHRNKPHSIHHYLDSLGYVTEKEIKTFTTRWLLELPIMKRKEDYLPLCPICKKEDRRTFILNIGANYITIYCGRCGYSKVDKDKLFKEFRRRQRIESNRENKQMFLLNQRKMMGWMNESI